MTNKRDVGEVLKSVIKLINEAKNLENKIENNSPKKILKFSTQKTSTKSKFNSYSDWSGKKFTDHKSQSKKFLSNKKVEKIFKKELKEWLQVNLNKVLS